MKQKRRYLRQNELPIVMQNVNTGRMFMLHDEEVEVFYDAKQEMYYRYVDKQEGTQQ